MALVRGRGGRGMAIRGIGIIAGATVSLVSMPASAQFFFKPKDLRGTPVTGAEPDIGQPLPGATGEEQRAAVAWNMRAALNVAALQCQFEPTLNTVANYNAILTDHQAELKTTYTMLTKYFVRVNKTTKAGQTALDQFGTRTYSSFATVAAQYNFCKVAGEIGREALFVPRGGFAQLSLDRMRELRNSLTPWGEQQFYGSLPYAALPRFDEACWKKGSFVEAKCGPAITPVSYAAR